MMKFKGSLLQIVDEDDKAMHNAGNSYLPRPFRKGDVLYIYWANEILYKGSLWLICDVSVLTSSFPDKKHLFDISKEDFEANIKTGAWVLHEAN